MDENITIYGSGKNEDAYISYYADEKHLLNDYDAFQKYVKGIEACVRMDDRYKTYVGVVRNSGFNKCAILGDVVEKGGDKITLEMHHGPIFNLFDYCAVVLRYHLIKKDIPYITTYAIADEILDCHEKGWIMLVMLSKTPHVGTHKKNVLIDIKATIGDINKFIDKYYVGMSDEEMGYISRYLEACKKANHKSTDEHLFDVAEKLKSFN